MGTRARGLGRGRLEGAKAGKSLLIDWVGRVQWGPRLCRRWERSGVGASMEDLARALCQGWWAREGFQVVYGQVTVQMAVQLLQDGEEQIIDPGWVQVDGIGLVLNLGVGAKAREKGRTGGDGGSSSQAEVFVGKGWGHPGQVQ